MTSLILMFVLIVTSATGMPSPQVTTRSGRVRGRYVQTRDGRTVMAFLGVPFAKPPVGSLRFEPPQPVDPWKYELLAVTQPPPCLQPLNPRGSEDCLYLNIYTPDTEEHHRYPVMVFFYPGSFEIGAADGYTHEYFLDEDVVLVVVQYRLGLLGFLSTGDEVVPGNMGIKDVRCALRWLNENIRCFGGDPTRVTIMGESAGSASVHYLMLFAAHEGLFWAGISQSGTATFTSLFRPPAEIEKMVLVLSELSGCPSDSQGFVDCLKTRPGTDIINLYSLLYKNVMYTGTEDVLTQFLPFIGGVIEPECVEDRLITGNPWHFNTSVPWLVGVNSKEALFYFVAELNDRTEGLFFTFNEVFDIYLPQLVFYQNSQADGTKLPPQFRQFYLDSLPISRTTLRPLVDGLSDAIFVYGTYEAIMRANKEKTYVYYFDYVGKNELFAIPYDSRIGADHTDESFFFFPHPGLPFPDRQNYVDKDDTTLSRELVKMWTNFASCLDPTPVNSCSVRWQSFSEGQRFLNITQRDIFMDEPFLPDRMSFWRSQPFPYRDDHFDTPSCKHENGTSSRLRSCSTQDISYLKMDTKSLNKQ